jgi:uncharacterized protein
MGLADRNPSASTAPAHPAMSNRLARETSPYLRQHRDNPVDWYPWGEEAFSAARGEDRPILLSVGYSACHWCHVMERESFEDPETAALMNELFVNVKVDREERPDVDGLYMSAIQRMTGHGGWPLTAFLTPDGRPFYGGTYFPPQPRHGLPSFRQVLAAVHQAYSDRRDEVLESAATIQRDLEAGALLQGTTERTGEDLAAAAAEQIMTGFDPRHGGFGPAPKFPQPMVLEFLLRHHRRTGDENALRVVERTLDGMAAGGIWDHLGGGFHRYSVDARWLVPHFEKMLYDNALLGRTYLYGFQVSGTAAYRTLAEELLAYVQREMTSPGGAFYAAQDADSEGEEGRYFVWSAEEVDELLGDDAPLFRRYYGITSGGNFEGSNILHLTRSLEAVASEAGVDEDRLARIVERGREKLLEARRERIAPARDDKIITSWNGLMIRAFAEACHILDEAAYGEAAVRAADFILEHSRRDGVLYRVHTDGRTAIPGFLEDYAAMVDGLHFLYEATFDRRWIREARALADEMIERFWDPEEGLFFDAPAGETDLIVRPRDPADNATPSGNSLATHALLRLEALVAEPRYREVAAAALEKATGLLERAPSAFGQLLCALDQYLAPPREVAIVGEPGAEATKALLRVLAARYNPEVVVALAGPREVDKAATDIPLLRDRSGSDGDPRVYVCERFACQAPVSSPDELANLLDRETLAVE